jgi:nicotinate-nucleotide adenylyltransferase
MTAQNPIGIFGGTFDPLHFGHLRLAEEAREALGLAMVRFVPSGSPPHRCAPVASPQTRLAMVTAAVSAHPAFCVDPGEINAAGPSYTVLTLRRLRAEYGPAQPLVLLMGTDVFAGLTQWFCWEEVLSLVHIGLATRPSPALPWPAGVQAVYDAHHRTDATPLTHPCGGIFPFEMTPLAISSTLIRQRLAQGQSVRYLVPDAVLSNFPLSSLYGTPSHAAC